MTDELEKLRANLKAPRPAGLNGVSPDGRHRQRLPVDLDAAAIIPIDWTELWGVDSIGEDWFIEPILPRGRQAGLFSPAGLGKSLLALDIAAAKATGRSVLGRPAQPAVSIVYIDEEMTREDLRERLTDLGYGEDDDLSNLHYYQLASLPPLDTPEGGDVLMAIVERYQAHGVILDTMARVVEGDENLADTYRAFYRCTGCRLKATGVALLRLDHAGKDPTKGQRGSSSKNDDLDVVWRLSTIEDRVVLTRTKSRVSYVSSDVLLIRETEPTLRHVLAPVGVPSGIAEVIELLDELDVALDATTAVAMRTLKTASHGKRRANVLAAQRVRQSRLFPESGNRSTRAGTAKREPIAEPVESANAPSQVRASKVVPGTMQKPAGTDPESIGSRVPLRSREPDQDRPESNDLVSDDESPDEEPREPQHGLEGRLLDASPDAEVVELPIEKRLAIVERKITVAPRATS